MKHSLLLIAVILMVMACKPTVPSEYIHPQELEDLLYDYHVAEAMAKNDTGSDRNRHTYFHAVLKKYNVTEAEFDSSLVYYYSHLTRLTEIYGRVNERLADEAKRLGAVVGDVNRYSQYSASGDTANIWTGVSDVMLIPRPTRNRFDFTIVADSTFQQGDSFMLQFMAEYIWQSGVRDAVACIKAVYEGDSIVQVANHVNAQGSIQVRVPSNDCKLQKLRGFIYLPDGDEDKNLRKMMFISQIQFIRFHQKKPVIAHEPASKADSQSANVKKDSVQRSDNTRGKKTGTTSRRVVERVSSESHTVEMRAATN